jgi:hypothetical protein
MPSAYLLRLAGPRASSSNNIDFLCRRSSSISNILEPVSLARDISSLPLESNPQWIRAKRQRCAEKQISFSFICLLVTCPHPPTSSSTSDCLLDDPEVQTLWSQIHHSEFQPLSLKHVTRSQRIGVDIRLVMGMKEPCFPAIENRVHTRWISEPEDTPSIPN